MLRRKHRIRRLLLRQAIDDSEPAHENEFSYRAEAGIKRQLDRIQMDLTPWEIDESGIMTRALSRRD